MPVRSLRSPRPGRTDSFSLACPPWLATGPEDQPFDFCGHIVRLLADIATGCPEFGHIRVERILVGVVQARNGRGHGLQARVTPLRFPGGHLTRPRRGVPYRVQRFFLDDREFFYLMTFCLPRFLNQDFDDKFVTLFHELYHLGPLCNGELRRHHGRYQLHTHSQRQYDRRMADLARTYLAGQAESRLHDFLRLNFHQLAKKHGAVIGVVVPRPKIIPMLGSHADLENVPTAADHPQESAK